MPHRRRQTRSYRWLSISLALLCTMLIAVGGWLFWQGGGSAGAFSPSALFAVEGLDPNARQGALPGSPAQERSPGANIFGYRLNVSPSFSLEGLEGDLLVENPSFNRYLLVVELCLEGEPSVLYRSQYIPPGYYIEKATLFSPLESGEHRATAYLNLIDPETLELVDILDCSVQLQFK